MAIDSPRSSMAKMRSDAAIADWKLLNFSASWRNGMNSMVM